MESAIHILDLDIEEAMSQPPQINTVFALADVYRDLKENKELLEDALKSINLEIEKTEEALTTEMINEENSKFTRKGKTFYLTEKLHVHSLADFRDDLHKSLKEHGFGALVKETVHPSTLKGFVKEQLEDADELPDWVSEYITYIKKPAIGMRKG